MNNINITAIICEYNPLTNGHVKHLNLAREETKCDAILCIMSGSFTQRGDAAILDKYIRAELAVMNGADIVVELPTIYAISPADEFALGAMKIIMQIPEITHLSFGSECGDIKKLEEIAKIIYDEPNAYKKTLREQLDLGYSYPKARAEAIKSYIKKCKLDEDLISVIDSPNNILGISYINAAKKLNIKIKFHTISRNDNYNTNDMEEELPSAMAVRNALFSHKKHIIAKSVPKNVYNTLIEHRPRLFSLGDIILFKIRSIDGYKFESYYDISGGIHNRIKIAAEKANTYEDMIEKAKNKNVTLARIKRICLYALFDITQKFYDEVTSVLPYIQVLVINSEMRDELLSILSASTQNVLTRYADSKKLDKILKASFKLDFTAQGTLNIANKSTTLNRSMVVIKRS